MTKAIADTLLGNKKSAAVDWAVFAFGALSLVVAIGGTVLVHADQLAQAEAEREMLTVSAG